MDSWTDKDSDGTSSDANGDTARQRTLNRTSRRRARQLVASSLDPTLAGISLLERSSVTKKTEVKYRQHVEKFLQDPDLMGRRLVEDSEVDGAVVEHLNKLFGLGRPPSDGDLLLVGLLFFQPQYGKRGGQSLPRAWRALLGWRKKAPGRSRRPLPRSLWSGIIWMLCLQGHWLMGVQLLLMVVTYCRPGELSKVEQRDSIAPMDGVVSGWSILLTPLQQGVPSKTLSYDDTGDTANRIYPWVSRVIALLTEGDPKDRVFPYEYCVFAICFRRAIKQLRLKDVVPYQARHSGASIDRSASYRSQLEVKKRGRWRSDNSIGRYEKAGRLGQVQGELDTPQLAFFKAADRDLEELFFGNLLPTVLRPP